MQKSRWIGLALLLSAAAVLCGLALSRSKLPTWQLPDGSVLSVRKITFGTNHLFRYAGYCPSFLEPIIPKPLRAKLKSRTAIFGSAPDTIAVWLQRSEMATRRSTPMELKLAILDENGFRTFQNAVVYRYGYGAPSGEVAAFIINDYPHASKQLKIEMHWRNGPGEALVQVGEFSFVNRAKSTRPRWQPEFLPASRNTNGIVIRLLDLETGLSKVKPRSQSEFNWSRARFEIVPKDKKTEEWKIWEASAFSPTGLRRIGSVRIPQAGSSIMEFHFNGTLWLDEPAWRIVAAVSRQMDFPPEQLWRIENVEVPAPDPWLPSEVLTVPDLSHWLQAVLKTNILHSELIFAGTVMTRVKNPAGSLDEELLVISLRTPYPLPELKIDLLEVKDQAGRHVPLISTVSLPSDGGRGVTLKEMHYHFSVKLPEGAKSLNITFSVTPVTYVEFLAKPTIAPSNRALK